MNKPNTKYDAIVIGAGHNGLACANYLAREGRKVLILEAAAQSGGLAANREFAPGFYASVAHTLPQMSRQLIRDLELHKHGFELAATSLNTIALDNAAAPTNSAAASSKKAQHINISGNSLEGVNSEEQQAFQEYQALMVKFANAIKPFWHKTPPRIGSGVLSEYVTFAQFGWKLRTLGKDDMREFARMIALPAQDLMDEFFSNPLLKGALSWDINIGNKLAPRSPNNALLNLLYRLSGDLAGSNSYLTGALPLPKGGMGGLIAAMESAAKAKGVEIRLNSPVEKVLVESHTVTGVRLSSGEEISCPVVISNADPKTSFFKLLGAEHLQVQFTHRINRLRNKGMVAKLHLGLKALPTFTGINRPDARLLIAPSMQHLENSFDFAKYGECGSHPAMEVIIPTVHDDSLAPKGQHVLSANIQYVPHTIKGGWDAHRDALMESVLNTLEAYAPGIRDQIVASELLTPEDLEKQFRVQGGHWHHVEFCIDQWWMNRPTYGASQYKTPVPGFYLCGAGAHPGGGIMGAAGANAAKEVISNEH